MGRWSTYLKRGRVIETESDNLFIEWFAEFWDSDIYQTPQGFIAYETHADHLFISHFFIGKSHRKTIREFHDFFKDFKKIARELNKKKILTTIDKTTPRYKALLYIEQKVAKFVLTDEDPEKFMLEYVL